MANVYISSDHAGYLVKNEIIIFLKKLNYNVIDLGTNSDKSVDYPDYAFALGEKVASDPSSFGVVICGTGIGISIASNKVKGIRAAILYSDEVARLAKEHNNANVISFGARTMTIDEIKNRIKIYLNAKYEKRHEKRINKIKLYEKEHKNE